MEQEMQKCRISARGNEATFNMIIGHFEMFLSV